MRFYIENRCSDIEIKIIDILPAISVVWWKTGFTVYFTFLAWEISMGHNFGKDTHR